ncbi:MAG: hypothetical protein FWD83_08465 [Promicromonosporaceae bacterium]|nr:hypothetical protein [Promicromonosporaceae bacterium]
MSADIIVSNQLLQQAAGYLATALAEVLVYPETGGFGSSSVVGAATESDGLLRAGATGLEGALDDARRGVNLTQVGLTDVDQRLGEGFQRFQ